MLALFLILIFIVLYPYINKNLETFWVYGLGTRICNNRGCDIRYDKGMSKHSCNNNP
jgi:hypothetical protein